MKSRGEDPLAFWPVLSGMPRAGKTPDLEFPSWLLDNYGGEKQTTRMRDGSVRASQIDFLGYYE